MTLDQAHGTGTAQWAEAITLGDALLRAAAATPDAVALITPDGSWTFHEFAERSEGVARNLIGLGVGPGDHVGVLIPNSFELLTTIFGVAMSGAAIVPINARYRSAELGFIAQDAELVAIVTSDLSDGYVDFLGLLGEALPGLDDATDARNLAPPSAPNLRSIVMLGEGRTKGVINTAAFDAIGAEIDPDALEARRARIGIRDSWMVLYTSGTTSRPRGCLISHEAQIRVWSAVARAFRLSPEDSIWNPCPMFHVAALGVTVACILAGATNMTTRFYEPSTSLDQIEAERPTVLYPAYANIILGVLNHPRAAEVDFTSATRMLVCAAPQTLRDIQARLPHATLISTFGMTESAGCSTAHSLDDSLEVRTETVGRALRGLESRIVDPDTLEELPRGEPGEIQLRGPLLCDGYYKDPEKTASAFLPEGWLRTGDRGTMDAAGRLGFLGRIRDVIKVGGENVSPAEVEAHLMTHPSVNLAVIVGIPDPRLEEIPVAFVELRPGASATEEELLDHCRGKIARFKVPHMIRFVTEWPMSATKIQKDKLKESLLEELAAAPART